MKKKQNPAAVKRCSQQLRDSCPEVMEMFKMLILRTLYGMSDEEMEF